MPVVETPLGPVGGKQGTECLEFLGIRYARPPVGPLRFQPTRTGSTAGPTPTMQRRSAPPHRNRR